MTTWEDWQSGVNPFISASRILSTVALVGPQQLEGETGNQFWLLTMIPAIVMKAFSCELMLKALIAYEGIAVGKTHKLNELFNRLPVIEQNRIQALTIEKMKLHNDLYDAKNFIADLDSSSELFVDWRYFFEEATSKKPKIVNLTFLDVLFTELELLKNSLR